jgi:hypothetical protein
VELRFVKFTMSISKNIDEKWSFACQKEIQKGRKTYIHDSEF